MDKGILERVENVVFRNFELPDIAENDVTADQWFWEKYCLLFSLNRGRCGVRTLG